MLSKAALSMIAVLLVAVALGSGYVGAKLKPGPATMRKGSYRPFLVLAGSLTPPLQFRHRI